MNNKILLIKINDKFIKLSEPLSEMIKAFKNMSFNEFRTKIFSYEFELNILSKSHSDINFISTKNEYFEIRNQYFRYQENCLTATNFKIISFKECYENLWEKFDQVTFQELIKLGADINYRNSQGQTLLEKNISDHLNFSIKFKKHKYLETCQFLLENGAEIKINSSLQEIINASRTSAANDIRKILNYYQELKNINYHLQHLSIKSCSQRPIKVSVIKRNNKVLEKPVIKTEKIEIKVDENIKPKINPKILMRNKKDYVGFEKSKISFAPPISQKTREKLRLKLLERMDQKQNEHSTSEQLEIARMNLEKTKKFVDQRTKTKIQKQIEDIKEQKLTFTKKNKTSEKSKI